MKIRHGLLSPHADVRSWAAFRVGGNALQHHDWGLGLVPQVIELLEGRMDSINVLRQVTHSLGKIGGREAMKMLLQLLRQAGVPTEIKVTALHAPFRFWQDPMFSSSASADLLPEFRGDVSEIVKTWPRALRTEVKQHELFEHLPASIRAQVSEEIRPGIKPRPLVGERAPAAGLVARSLMSRLDAVARADPELSLKIKIVVLQDDKPDELCPITIQNGIVETCEPRRGVDMKGSSTHFHKSRWTKRFRRSKATRFERLHLKRLRICRYFRSRMAILNRHSA